MADITYSYLVQEQQIVDSVNIVTAGQTQDKVTTYYTTDMFCNYSGAAVVDSARTTTKPTVVDTSEGSKYFGLTFYSYDATSGQVTAGRQFYAESYTVVLLNSEVSKDYYYTFKTGKQYVKVADKWKYQTIGTDFLPIQSETYEYIDTYKSNTAYADMQKVYYTYSYEKYGYVSTDVPYTTLKEFCNETSSEDKQKYMVSLSYTYNTYVSTYVELRNNNGLSHITSDAIYEDAFKNYTGDVSAVNNTALQYLGLYSRGMSYIKINKPQIAYIQSVDPDNTLQKLYYYNPLIKNYTVCKKSDIGAYSATYIGALTYTQITDVITNIENPDYYIKQQTWNSVDKDVLPTASTLYYSTNELIAQEIYIPHNTGVVTDGSVDYYDYTYVELTSNNDTSSIDIYVKQNYKAIAYEEQATYISEGYTIYEQSTIVQKIIISEKTLYDSIVTDGSIIYTDTNGEAYNLDELKTALTKALAKFADKSQADILKLKQQTLNGSSTEYSATNIVKAKLNYSGVYKEVSNPVPDEDKQYYIAGTGYYKLSDKKLYGAGYNTTFYTYKYGKIDPKKINHIENVCEDITKLCEYSNNYDIADFTTLGYNDDNIYLCYLNSYGFIKNDNIYYYDKIHNCIKSDDWYMLPNKEYYTYSTSGTLASANGTLTVSAASIDYTGDEAVIDGYPGITVNDSSAKYYTYTQIGYSICNQPKTYDLIRADLTNTTYAEYINTKYFYATYTDNDGIHLGTNGSYYTNIYVFDANKGAISKMLYLNQHVVNNTTYTYNVPSYTYEYIKDIAFLQTIKQIDYPNYYAKTDAGQYVSFDSDSTLSPYEYALLAKATKKDSYIYVKTESTVTYNYIGTGYQCVNAETQLPLVLQYGDLLFGAIKTSSTDSNNKVNANAYLVSQMYMYTHNTSYGKDTFIDGTYNVTKNVIQDAVPFYLANDVSYEATGSYIWHAPSYVARTVYEDTDNGKVAHTYHYYDSIGWWETEYSRNVNPLLVSSYTFYPDTNSISNITATYSFTPNSYILTATIEYPEISYSALIAEESEYFYYTYFTTTGNVERFTGNVNYNAKDGEYYGLIGTTNTKLTKVRGIRNNIVEKKHIEQEASIAYTYFAYKTSLELTNEKVPYLYNTELRPAVTKEVNIWNSDKSAYETQVVVMSYSYYAYNYMYDTIPFKVASYIFQGSYLTIDNFDDLGAYIANASDGLSSILSYQVNSIDKFDTNMTELTAQEVAAINNAYTLMVNAMNTASYASSTNAYISRTQLTNDIHNLSYDLSNTLTDNLCDVSSNVSSLDTHLNDNFTTFNSYYTYQNDTNRNTLSEDISALRSYMHADMAGTSILSYVTTAVDKDGNIVWEASDKSDITTSISDTLRNLLTNVKTTTTTYTKDGLTYTTVQYAYTGIGNMLNRLEIAQAAPTKKEFVVDVAAKLFTSVDFETEVVDSVQYDENGNITDKKSHKNNPTEIAKKSIYRATVLWKELEKEGFV